MEEKPSRQEFIIQFVKKNLLFIGLISFGVLLMILGFFQYLASKNQTSDIQFTSNNNQTTDVKGVQTTAKISVDVEGKLLS